jgi:hypothetical protein
VKSKQRVELPPCPTLPDIPDETPEQRAARYERALRAIAGCTLMGADFGDWVQAVCTDVLDGMEAECWICGTHVHDGLCVGEEEAEPPDGGAASNQ